MVDNSSRLRDENIRLRDENIRQRAELDAIRAADTQRTLGEVLAEVDNAQLGDILATDGRDTPSTLTPGEAAAEANPFQRLIHHCFPFWFQPPINQENTGEDSGSSSQRSGTNQPINQASAGEEGESSNQRSGIEEPSTQASARSSSNQASSVGATRGSSTSRSVSGPSQQSRYTDATIPTRGSAGS